MFDATCISKPSGRSSFRCLATLSHDEPYYFYAPSPLRIKVSAHSSSTAFVFRRVVHSAMSQVAPVFIASRTAARDLQVVPIYRAVVALSSRLLPESSVLHTMSLSCPAVESSLIRNARREVAAQNVIAALLGLRSLHSILFTTQRQHDTAPAPMTPIGSSHVALNQQKTLLYHPHSVQPQHFSEINRPRNTALHV